MEKDKNTQKKESKANEVTSAAIAGAASCVADATSRVTDGYNEECNNFRNTLGQKAESIQNALDEKLATNPDYVGDRSKGVDLAYQYEKADVIMGGKGSADWNAAERAELVDTGKVRGYEGHHINSVAEQPALQANPDNVAFVRGRKEHLARHDGDFRNPSSGPLVSKDCMLERTNLKRVLANEAMGCGLAVLSGAMIGVGSSVLSECKAEGFSFKSVKNGLKKSFKPAAQMGIMALASYATVRILNVIVK